MWKEFWYYSREERRGILVLVVLIVATLSVTVFLSLHKEKNTVVDRQKFDEEYEAFIASLKSDSAHHPSVPHRNRQAITPVPFDPNTADSLTFLRIGLPSWMAGNILRYRAKGGKFRTPEGFRKVYGLTEEQYVTLLPYIYIREEAPQREIIAQQTEEDTISRPLAAVKYAEPTILNLNSADTTELKKIPGIGSGIAGRIVRYRKQLGGFYRVEQLQEIPFATQELNKWFRVEADETIRMNINKVSIDRLRSHPYINFYQARAIVEYRRKKGPLKDIRQLRLYEEFTEEDLERIACYIVYE